MKYLQTIALAALAIIILFSFQACSSEEPTFETEEVTTAELDTTVLENFVTVSSNGSLQQLQGIYATCTFDGERYTNVLAYGTDLVIVDGEGEFENDLFVQYWETAGPLEVGTYLTEGEIISSDPLANPEPFFEVEITEVNEFLVQGRFRSVDLMESDDFMEVQGNFITQRYPCEALDIEDGDFGEYATGRATIFNDGVSDKVVMSATSICDEGIIEGQSESIGIILLGGLLDVDSDGSLDIEVITDMGAVFLDQQSDYLLNEKHMGYYVENFEALSSLATGNNNLINDEMLEQLGVRISVEYSEIGEKFTTGKIYTLDNKVFATFDSNSFICG